MLKRIIWLIAMLTVVIAGCSTKKEISNDYTSKLSDYVIDFGNVDKTQWSVGNGPLISLDVYTSLDQRTELDLLADHVETITSKELFRNFVEGVEGGYSNDFFVYISISDNPEKSVLILGCYSNKDLSYTCSRDYFIK